MRDTYVSERCTARLQMYQDGTQIFADWAIDIGQHGIIPSTTTLREHPELAGVDVDCDGVLYAIEGECSDLQDALRVLDTLV